MSLKARYAAAAAEREPVLERCRESAALTLPHLAPDLTQSKGEDLVRPFQSTGGDGVNNLGAKLSIGLFPPQSPGFRYELDADLLLANQVDEQTLGSIRLAISKRERSIQRRFDTSGARPRTFEALLHLIVNGNYLLRFKEDGSLRGFRIDQFTVARDHAGFVREVMTHEVVHRQRIPERFRDRAAPTDLPHQSDDDVDVFTVFEREEDSPVDAPRWRTWQEDGEGNPLSEREEGIADVDSPMIPLRMIPDSNEDYGRSWVEFRYSDLKAHEGLTQAMIEAAAIASHVIRVIEPGAQVTPRELHTAPNGRALIGFGEKIKTLNLDKLADLTVAAQVNDALRLRLDQGFLRFSPRNAERVTTEEIRATLQELNEALGGVLSTAAAEFQLPLVLKLERIMDRRGELFPLPFRGAEVTGIKIVTGIDAVGRGRDEIQLNAYLGTAQQALGPEVVALHINPSGYLSRLAAAQGIDPEGIVRTEEEVQAIQQQQQQAALLERSSPQLIKALENATLQQPQEGQ